MSAPDAPPEAGVTVVVPVLGQLPLVRRCVSSLRDHTDVPLELVLVDNGSDEETARWIRDEADAFVRFEVNRGFAAGMNAGLEVATRPYVVFLNSDTEVPAGWASMLSEHLETPSVGLAVPAVTRAGVPVTVRSTPGTDVVRLPPFSQPPSGVVYAMRIGIARDIGGFSETYGLGGGEDLDLCFKLWVNNLDVVFDTRVVVQHVSKATASTVFPDWPKHWDRMADRFFEAWTSGDRKPARLETCDAATYERNVLVAASVATWMQDYVLARRSLRFPAQAVFRRASVRYPAVAGLARTVFRRLRIWTQRTLLSAEGS